MAKRRTARQWASSIRRYQSSGLTQAAFCQRYGIALSTLTFHLRRHRAQPDVSGQRQPAPKLVELKLPVAGAKETGAGVRIELRTPEGVPVSIRCHSGQVGEILAQIGKPLSPGS